MLNLKILKQDAKDFSILYVGTEGKLRDRISSILTKIFDHIYVASDGNKAFKLFKQHHQAVVIMVIPSTKSYCHRCINLAKAIKKLNFKTKIIVLSDYDEKDILYESIEIGIYRFFKKPIDIKDFVLVLHSVVQSLKKEQLYNGVSVKKDIEMPSSKTIFPQLLNLYKKSMKVELHNFYKGISITHEAIIKSVGKDSVTFHTDYMQIKAIRLEGRSIITADNGLSGMIICDKVAHLYYSKQIVELKQLHYKFDSPINRTSIRVVPDDDYTIFMKFNEHQFHSEIKIENISRKAICLNFEGLPAGLVLDDIVELSMTFNKVNKHIDLTTKAKMLKIIENSQDYSIVFMLELDSEDKQILRNYITSRQMEIIREFKANIN